MSNDSKLTESGQPAEQPPTSNTGVSGKNLRGNYQYSIDWIRYSAPSGNNPVDYLPEHEVFQLSGEVSRPASYYEQYAILHAARVDWHEQRPAQGALITMTGQDCQYAVAHGVNLQDVLSHGIYGVFGKFSRLDFAIDVFIPGASPQHILDAWNEGRVTSPAQTCTNYGSRAKNGADAGQTVYIGSPSSPRKIRVYDKAKQTGHDGAWIRIEIECKGDYAQSLANSMLISGIVPAGKAAIDEFLQIEGCEWFDGAVFGNEFAWLEPIERKVTNRMRWYMEQILPAIERDLMAGNYLLHEKLEKLVFDYDGSPAQHGGTTWIERTKPTPLKNSNKALRGVQILQNEGFGVEFRNAFEQAGKELIIKTCERFGYVWNTKKQRWERG